MHIRQSNKKSLPFGDIRGGREALSFSSYDSPSGELVFCSDSEGVAGLWFAGRQKLCDELARRGRVSAEGHNMTVRLWLDEYFGGHEPGFMPPLSLHGSAFDMKMWEMLVAIPFGTVVTYGEIARRYAAGAGIARMSAQAVGGAVGRNPVCIIIPCHRVVGAGNRLTGYREGLDKKAALLGIEGLDVSRFAM